MASRVYKEEPQAYPVGSASSGTQTRKATAEEMKTSDLKQAARILAMIQLLTEEECSSVEICNDNPDPSDLPDCVISILRGMEPDEDYKEFRGNTLAECLEAALQEMGLQVPVGASVDWAGRYAILRAAVADLMLFLPMGTSKDLRDRLNAAMEAKPEFGNWRSHVPRLTDEQITELQERWGITGGVSESELRTLAEDIRTL